MGCLSAVSSFHFLNLTISKVSNCIVANGLLENVGSVSFQIGQLEKDDGGKVWDKVPPDKAKISKSTTLLDSRECVGIIDNIRK